MTQAERARPYLGTVVSIRVTGLEAAGAHAAIEVGFEEIARVHRDMSFHDPRSDVSRLNRTAHRAAVTVADTTFAVLERALAISAASGGVFDITIARHLVDRGMLPNPDPAQQPDRLASWADIELSDGGRVRFHRPLWIDLGGIAKGYAVDRAVQRMGLPSGTRCVVNAGGDLRISGAGAEPVVLSAASGGAPSVMLCNASIASSSGRNSGHAAGPRRVGPHVHATRRRTMGLDSFVSVIADECMDADALTKVVMARGGRAAPVLRRFGARAYLHTARRGWRLVGFAPDGALESGAELKD